MDISRDVIGIIPMAESIQGWLDPKTGAGLYALVRSGSLSSIVELGAWKGKSTVWLASGVRDRGFGQVFSVDTWEGSDELQHRELLRDYATDQLFQEFWSNMEERGLGPYVTPVRGDTWEVGSRWRGEEIGFLFIDAAHDYEHVRRDFEIWSPHVARGGFIVFDDVKDDWPGPARVVSELPRWVVFQHMVGPAWIGQKV